jgi:hypothetical protein
MIEKLSFPIDHRCMSNMSGRISMNKQSLCIHTIACKILWGALVTIAMITTSRDFDEEARSILDQAFVDEETMAQSHPPLEPGQKPTSASLQ